MHRKILILLVVILADVLSAQSIKEINVVSEDWSKFTRTDGSGLYFDILRMVYEPLGIKVNIDIYPYSRSIKMVEKKLADVWLGSYIDEEEFAVYPKYFFDYDTVTAMFKSSRFPGLSGVEGLEKKDTCWVRGYAYDKYIDVNLIKHERNDRKSILLSLDKDRFDVFLDDKSDMRDAIQKLKFDTTKYKFVEIAKFELYPAFRNDDKGKELRLIWDREFKKYMDNGSLKKLYTKYDEQEFYLSWEKRHEK